MPLPRFRNRDLFRSNDGSATHRRRRNRRHDRRETGFRPETLESRAMLAGVNQVYTNFPDGIYGPGATIPIVVEFDQAVTVTGPARLYLNAGGGFNTGTGIGSPNGVAYWSSSSFDGRSHTFLYTVTAGDASPDLDVFASNALNDTLINGTFRDGSGVFNPILPVVPQTNRMSLLKDIVIDGTAPVVPTVNPLRINPQIEITDPPFWLQHPDYFTLHGTAGTTALPTGEKLQVTVNGATYTPTVGADGKWSVDLRHDAHTGATNPWSTTNLATYDVVARVVDLANNASVDTTLNEVTIDMDPPSVVGLLTTASPGKYNVGDTITFDIVFDEPVSIGGSGIPYIALNNGSQAQFVSCIGALARFSYTVKVGDAELTNLQFTAQEITLNGGRLQDLAANQPLLNGAKTAVELPVGVQLPFGIDVDTSAPTCTVFEGLTVDGWYGPGQTIVLQVEFSEDVIITGALELSLNSAPGAKATMLPLPLPPGTPTKVAQFSYTVTQGDSTTSFANPSGILEASSVAGLSLAGGLGSVVDLAGNNAVLTLPSAKIQTGATGNKYQITSRPVVTSVTSPDLNGTYTAGDQITVIVQFDRPIAVTTLPTAGPNPVVPSLQLNASPTAPHATYDTLTHSASNQAAGRLILTYTVAAGEFTAAGIDLDYLSTTSLQSGGYAITHRDAVHVPAVLTLPVPGTGSIGSLDFNKNLRIVLDTLAPLSPTIALADGTGLSPADRITFNPTVQVSGLEPLSTWQYSIDNGLNWSSVVRTNASTTFLLPAGTYPTGTVQVRQIDASGNVSPAGVNAVVWTVDQTAPGVVSGAINDTAIAGDGITNDSVVIVAGVEVGAQVQFSTAGSTGTFAAGFGSTFSLPVGTYAAGSIWVRQMDTAGNIGVATPVNPSAAVTVDTSAAALVVSLLNDSGVSNTDLVTADPRLAFGGLETGATVQYWDGSIWGASFTPVEGSNTVTVRQVDLAGNQSPSTTFSFTLDRTVPLAVTVSLLLDTGASVLDGITSNPALNIAGQEAGASLEYSINGGAWSAGYAPADGGIAVQVRQVDLVGNRSPASLPFVFTLDRTAPINPTVGLVFDSGISGADKVTNDGRLAIGGLDAGATVLYSVNGAAYSTAYAPSEGFNTVDVKQRDLAGNESTATRFTFVLDSVAPSVPVVALQSDTGSSSTDRYTSVGALLITNRDANAVIEYSTTSGNGPWSTGFTPIEGLNAVWVRQSDIAGNGSSSAALFTFTLDRVAPTAPSVFLLNDTGSSPSDRVTRSGALGVIASETPVDVEFSVTNGIVWVNGQPTSIEGVNNILVRVTDPAGNSSPSSSFSYTYDTVAPAAPIVNLLNDTGISPTDRITSDPRLSVTGLVAGATTEYWDGSSSPWSLVQPAAVEGLNTVQVRQTDPAGNVSLPATFSFTLMTVAPPTVGVALQSDTGGSASDLVTSNPALAVSNLVSGAVVQYSTNGITYATTLTLAQGANTVLVRQMAPSGATSFPTPFTFVFDSVAPAALGVALQNDTGASATDRVTRDPTIAVTGLEAGAILSYSVNGGVTWGISYTVVPGANTVLVRQSDIAGNASPVTAITFVYDTTAPAAPGVALLSDTGASGSDLVTSNPGLVFTGLEANATPSFSTNGGATWSGTFVPVEGLNNVLVRQVDASGNESSLSTAFSFTYDTTNPTVTNVTSPNANGTYTPGQTIQIVVALSESVVLSAGTSAVLALNTGRTAVLATVPGSQTSSLTFNYTVQNGDVAGDLEYTSTNAMTVTAGSVRDVAGNDLNPTLPAPVAPSAFRALGSMSLKQSLGRNKDIVISSLLIATPGVGSTGATTAPQVKSAVTVIPIQFNMPVSRLTLSNIKLFLNNRLVSLAGASVTGSGTSWTLRLPAIASNLKGIYRLDVGGVTATSGVGMGGKVATVYWRRV